MSQWQNQQHRQTQTGQQPIVPQKRVRYRCRGWIVLVLLTGIGTIWLIAGMNPAFSFADVSALLNVINQSRFAQLGALGAGLIALTLILRIVIRRDDQN